VALSLLVHILNQVDYLNITELKVPPEMHIKNIAEMPSNAPEMTRLEHIGWMKTGVLVGNSTKFVF
jgi:hypothetical protein